MFDIHFISYLKIQHLKQATKGIKNMSQKSCMLYLHLLTLFSFTCSFSNIKKYIIQIKTNKGDVASQESVRFLYRFKLP